MKFRHTQFDKRFIQSLKLERKLISKVNLQRLKNTLDSVHSMGSIRCIRKLKLCKEKFFKRFNLKAIICQNKTIANKEFQGGAANNFVLFTRQNYQMRNPRLVEKPRIAEVEERTPANIGPGSYLGK